MMTLTANELKTEIKEQSELKNPLTLFVVGVPGVGKSFSIREAAAEVARGYILLSLGRLEAYDIKGVPMAVDCQVGKDILKFVKWIMPYVWEEVLRLGGNVIVHMDEFTLASPEVQSAVLDIIHEKKVDQVQMPLKTMFVLSGNMGGDDGTSAQQVTSAITGGRVGMITMNMPSIKDWIAYQKPLDRIKDFFLSTNDPTLLWQAPKADAPWEPWTNPRGWSKLDEMAKDMGLDLRKDEDIHKFLRKARLLHSSAVLTRMTDYFKDSVIDPVALFEGEAVAWGKYKKAGGTQDFKRSEALKNVFASIYGADSDYKDKDVRRTKLAKFFERLIDIGAGNGHADMINGFASEVGDKDPATYEKITLKNKEGKQVKIGEIFDSLLDEEEALRHPKGKK